MLSGVFDDAGILEPLFHTDCGYVVDISILYQEKIESRPGIYAQNTRELNIGPEYGF
jgi:hypothetical protein